MGANLEIAGPVKRTEQGNVDYYYGGGDYAWPSKAAAVAGVPAAVRPGKFVGVVESGKVTEYIWHPDNIADDGLTKVVTGDAGTVRMVTAGVSTGAIKAGDQVPVGTNATNATALEKFITAPTAPAFVLNTIYATTADINTLTAISIKIYTTGWSLLIAFAAESGGKKQRLFLPNGLTLGTIQFSQWDDSNRVNEFPVSGSGVLNGVSGKYYTYNGTDRGAVKVYLASLDAPAPANVWDDNRIWNDNDTWQDYQI